MQVTLKQKEIVAAITAHLGASGFGVNGKEISVKFTAGRKGDGLVAQVSIDEQEDIPGYGKADIPVKPHPAKVAAALAPRLEASTEGQATSAVSATEGVSAAGLEAGAEKDAVAASQEATTESAVESADGTAKVTPAPNLFN